MHDVDACESHISSGPVVGEAHADAPRAKAASNAAAR